jgi:hypothetical protein
MSVPQAYVGLRHDDFAVGTEKILTFHPKSKSLYPIPIHFGRRIRPPFPTSLWCQLEQLLYHASPRLGYCAHQTSHQFPMPWKMPAAMACLCPDEAC